MGVDKNLAAAAEIVATLARGHAAAARHEQAVVHFARALAFGAGAETAALHNDHGASLAALERHEAARVEFEAACAADPTFATAASNLGNALAALGRYAEAVSRFQAAIALDPEFAPAHGNLGCALLELHHPGDALPHLQRALALDPELAEVANALGRALVMLGDLAGAQTAFARAAVLQPERAEFYAGLAQLRDFAPDDPIVERITALAAREGLAQPERMSLHFTQYRIFEREQKYAAAFGELTQGNALRRAMIPYDEPASLGRMRQLREIFGASLLARASPAGGLDVPIFILGMPRSGSTLLEQIVASHPDVAGGGESSLLSAVADGLGGIFAPPYPANVLARSPAEFAVAGRDYAARLHAMAPEAKRITDKMPGNFHHVGLIRMLLPGSKIIHTRRDPLETCFSCYAQTFTKAQPFANDLLELARYYKSYAALMAHWREMLPGFMLEVDHEALVENFEPEVRRILDFCGLPWNERCLAFAGNPRVVLTASAAQVRRPLYQPARRGNDYGVLLQPLRNALA